MKKQKSYAGELWLVRHGRTSWNRERRYQGHSDVALLDDEASGLEELERELEGVSFSTVYCSDLLRCRQTLTRVRPDLAGKAVYDSRLREMNFGQWEGQTYEMLKNNLLYRAWIDDPVSVTPPGGEAWDDFHRRVSLIYEEWINLAQRNLYPEDNMEQRILAVTHGGVVALVSSLLHPGRGFWDTSIEAGGILRLKLGEKTEPETGKRNQEYYD
ncbi:histidine phosphatase family protein [Paenibacillus fonticola]|uniref:histidine phosphatase family protein n=1 Tax=Paenibacillus fonticola TaxID=379896 RepID=UPI000361B0BB|nr:histidine phosphatase family protein [Paenibacillus fonticola]